MDLNKQLFSFLIKVWWALLNFVFWHLLLFHKYM